MTYKIPKTEVTLDFSTWAFSEFCKVNGNMSITDMMLVFSNITPTHILSLLLCGAQNHWRKTRKGEVCPYTVDDAADWIDAVGGLSGQGFGDLFSVVARSINPEYQGAEVINNTGKEEEKKSLLAGISSESVASGQELETVK